MVEIVTDPNRIKELQALFSDPGGNFPKTVTDPVRLNELNRQFGFSSSVPDQGEFSLGVERGIENVKASSNIFGAALAQGVGANNLSDALIDNYRYYNAQAEALEGRINRVEDIENLGDFGNWLAGRLGENVPNILGIVLSAGAGGLLAKGLTRGVISQAEKQFLDRTLPGILPRTSVGKSALAGGTAFSTTVEGGGIAAEQFEEGFEIEPGIVVSAGLISGSLETLGVAIGLSAFGLTSAFRSTFLINLKKLPLPQRVAATAGLVGAAEGSVELTQELVAISARMVIDENFDGLGEEAVSRLKNALAGGLAVGTVLGGAGGVFGRGPSKKPRVDDTKAEENVARDAEGNQLALAAPQLQLPPPERKEQSGLNPPDVIVPPIGVGETLFVPSEGLPSRASQLDDEILNTSETKVSRLVNQTFSDEAVTEVSPNIAQDTVREAIQEQIGSKKTRLDKGDVLTTIDESGTVEYTNLNVAQTRRLNQLMAKENDFERDLTEKEYETMEKLLAMAANEEKVVTTKQTKEQQKELKDIGEEFVDESFVRRRESEGLRGRDTEQVRGLVNRIASRFPNAPTVTVVDHKDTVNDKVVFENGQGAKGLFVDRGNGPEIYIFSNEVGSNADVLRTYLHEVIGHAGLRAVFNEKEMRTFLRLINKDETQADEYVARLAESDPSQTLIKRIIALIRTALRRLGFSLKLSDNDIVAIIINAKQKFSSNITQSNFAILRTALSPATIEGYRKNLDLTMRFLSQVPVTKNKYIEISTLNRIAKKMNKQEKDLVDEILFNFNRQGLETKNITWEEFVEELERHLTPLTAVTLSEVDLALAQRDGLIDEDDLASIVQENPQYFNAETGRAEDTLLRDNYPVNENFQKIRVVLYEVPFRTVSLGGLDATSGLHFKRSQQLGWVRSADQYGSRFIAEIQSDLQQKVLSEKRYAHFANQRLYLKELDNLINSALLKLQTEVFPLNELNNIDELQKDITFWMGGKPELDFTTLTIQRDMYKLASNQSISSLKVLSNTISDSLAEIAEVAQISSLILKGKMTVTENVATQPDFDKLDALFPAYRQRLFRETLKQAAIDDMIEVVLPDVNKFSEFQFGFIMEEQITPEQASVRSHYGKFFKWVDTTYRGREGYSNQNGYIRIPVSQLDKGPITVLARRSQNLSREMGLPPDDPTPYAVDRFEGMWEFIKVKAASLFLNPLQIEIRYKIKEISEYLSSVQRWWNIKAKIIAGIEDLVTQWNALDKGRANALSNAIMDITTLSDDKQRRLSLTELDKIFIKYKLDEESKEIYGKVDKEMQKLLSRLEKGIIRNEIRIKLSTDPAAFMKDWERAVTKQEKTEIIFKYDLSGLTARTLLKIEKEFTSMRNRNYFPYVRFGRYVITATAKNDINYKGKSFEAGESVFMYAYESRAEQLLGQENHSAAFKDNRLYVQLGKLDDTEMTFMGMPPSLMTSIQNNLQLTEEQTDQLKHIFSNLSPGRSFMRELKQRSGLEGFSQESLRVFSSYMFSAANHIARVEQYLNMTKALDRLGDLRKVSDLKDSVVLAELHSYFNRHYKYIMNPGTDLAHVRALGFMFYLGGNVKSAVVNLTQIPMVAYPYLAARFSNDGAAVAALSRAINDTSAGLTGKPNYTRFENEDITRAIEEGFLDESQVTDIAGMGESHVLARIMPSNSGERFWNKLSYGSGYLFHQAELFNRRVTFVAARRLAEKQNTNREFIYQEAKRAVQTAQFEYSKWNRPEFMRGNKSVIFLFWQFMQQASFLAMGGQGKGIALRMLVMMLVASGVEGLPLAENILDILDFGGTKAKEALGMKNPRVDLREDLRIMLQELTDNPDIVMHGLARYYGLGPLHLFAALGVPVPEVDITSSLSMGKIVPGIEDLFQTSKNAEQKFARTIVEMGGPVVGIGWNFYKWAVVDEPDQWKAAERVLPVALKNLSKGVRRFSRGEETNRSGASIIDYEPGNWKENSELIAQGLGFASTRGNQKYELLAAQEEARRFWLIRRSSLLEYYGYAVITKDREGIKDARTAIRKFNKTVPAPQLKVRSDQMAQSVKLKRRKVEDMEKGISTQKLYRPVTQNVRKAFPEVP